MKRLLKKVVTWEYFPLVLIVIVVLAAHFSLIRIPAEPVFDEQHYVPDARSIISGNGTLRFEHPPLGKLFIVSGIKLFGDNAFGWRFFSVILGTGNVILVYLICRRLSMSRRASNLATFLFALENLSFVQAGVAMLDIYSVFFMLASFWLYLRGSYPLSAVFVALSALGKLNGALAIGAIFLHWLLVRRDRKIHFLASMLLVPVSFVLLMIPLDYLIFRYFVNPFQRILTMFSLSGSLTFATVPHGSKSRPWEWLIQLDNIPYWVNPNYFGAISYTILALIIPAALYLLYKSIKYHDAGTFGFTWFASTYLVWIPASLLTQRVTYVFYFYPVVGAVCLGLGLGMSQLLDLWKTRKLKWIFRGVIGAYLIAHVLVFAWLSPMSYWWGIPSIFQNIKLPW